MPYRTVRKLFLLSAETWAPERLTTRLLLATISLMTHHTAKNTFKVRRIIAAIAAVTIPVIGIVGAQTAAAEPPKTQPAPPRRSCTWNGQATSDGGYHTETSGSSWAKYKCDNGSWVKEASCTGIATAAATATAGWVATASSTWTALMFLPPRSSSEVVMTAPVSIEFVREVGATGPGRGTRTC
jgi:hypothetical protein